MNERLLFFILLPIVFEAVHLWICWENNDFMMEHTKITIGIFAVELCIDYLIEYIYLKAIKEILGVWMFSNEFSEIESYYAFEAFVICSIVYFVISCCLGPTQDELPPIIHTIALIILFAMFYVGITDSINTTIDEKTFNNMEYQIHEDVTYLRAMGDGHTTTGNINGKTFYGTGYIQGKIGDNYNLYYSYINENGETIIENLVYDDNVHIYEEGEKCNPRLITKKYYKSYETENNDFYSEYYVYDIYIPSMVTGVNVDME